MKRQKKSFIERKDNYTQFLSQIVLCIQYQPTYHCFPLLESPTGTEETQSKAADVSEALSNSNQIQFNSLKTLYKNKFTKRSCN